MMRAFFFLPQENVTPTNASHFSEGENIIKKLTKICWSKPAFKMEFEHKSLTHVVTCAPSVVAINVPY